MIIMVKMPLQNFHLEEGWGNVIMCILREGVVYCQGLTVYNFWLC